MKKLRIFKDETNELLAHEVLHANSFLTRLKGLMFVPEIVGGDAMLIEACNSIHTFFMKFSLDIVFLDKNNTVLKIIRNLKPWRMTFIIFKAVKTLELPAGSLSNNLSNGDKLRIENV
jgi:uncharacterized protein